MVTGISGLIIVVAAKDFEHSTSSRDDRHQTYLWMILKMPPAGTVDVEEIKAVVSRIAGPLNLAILRATQLEDKYGIKKNSWNIVFKSTAPDDSYNAYGLSNLKYIPFASGGVAESSLAQQWVAAADLRNCCYKVSSPPRAAPPYGACPKCGSEEFFICPGCGARECSENYAPFGEDCDYNEPCACKFIEPEMTPIPRVQVRGHGFCTCRVGSSSSGSSKTVREKRARDQMAALERIARKQRGAGRD